MPTALNRRMLDLAGLDVPVVEVTGADDGPRLTVIAGVHGCEYASMAAVRQWSASLAGRDLRGRVTVVPVLNLPAFRARSPFVVPEDGKNLNRCFPGRAVGGTTSAAAAQAGIPAITAEAGGCGLIEQTAVDLHLRGLDRVLAALGMDGSAAGAASSATRAVAPTVLSQFLWLRSQAAGWWQPAVSPGDSVAEGQLLGTVTTLDAAELLQSVHAPAAGVPMFITSSPAVEADGLLLGLGAV